ncbi:MAG: 1-acyl-sn-glycerol-3-phosphate acyltransferase [Candidatus Brocadia sp.]|nr:1-acyl-sn-glycerol-3-phosphate acyltransferase [Candidatus Brocadia sp.]MDG6026772.1 1-acyl-sn-glycerol-3-phosphate acyltransferase [Candidatus Brocadia sp.]
MGLQFCCGMKKGAKDIHHAKAAFFSGTISHLREFLNNCFFFVLKVTGVVLLKGFFHIQVYNAGYVPRKGPLIVAANHFSYMDPVALQSMFPRRIAFMMTELYYEGRGKWLFQLLHCICVKEQGSNRAALKQGMEVLNKNDVLGIFPEGGVSREGLLQEGNPGIGFLALKSGAPVIPAFISGTYQALPKGAKIPKISRITITFGKPMTFPHAGDLEKKKGMEEITRAIMEHIKKLSFSDKQEK